MVEQCLYLLPGDFFVIKESITYRHTFFFRWLEVPNFSGGVIRGRLSLPGPIGIGSVFALVLYRLLVI